MMKIKRWVVERFLQPWAKDILIAENDKLKEDLCQKDAKIAQLKAYISGIEDGIRAQRRIVINTGPCEVKKHERYTNAVQQSEV